ncbi:hypothetical protein SAMN05444396_107114 [Flavobacterium segetis]|uniref:PIN domain-containing protein n=1 Tax=Flavobacterium segetis TaxID=271157 RepID=A0A1M5IKT8_9FLAO|nr:hypothetical protein [Flavobacterium segetis]SHG28659.1 hypothetical protein SAMN05444396_107114 [Flavobacterium segetis]
MNTITTLHYLQRKIILEQKTRLLVANIVGNVSIIAVDINIIRESLRSNRKDFEDAIQIISALAISDMDCIVTRNLRDCRNAAVEIFISTEFLNVLN